MDAFQLLANGFAIALQPTNLAFAFLGCLLGNLIGVLPGIGPAAATAMLIPVTFVLEPTPAIIMLAAMYYGSMYGGTITSVLINVPGEPATAVSCLEGYPMAKQGRAGPVLAMAAIGSFVGGTIATMGLALIALPLGSLAVKLGPPEFFALMVLGLSLVAALAGRSLSRAALSASLGMLIAMVGVDPAVGAPRFTFGQAELLDGFGIVPVVMGLFGVGEILGNAERGIRDVFKGGVSVRGVMPTAADLRDSVWPILRGTAIGFPFGLLPGVGPLIPTFLSYVAEKRFSRTPERFGTGVLQGVVGPETANNACANAALIPLFTLGIPGSPTVAVLMGALIMNGLVPGPFLFKEHADFVWAVIASLYVGNAMLLVLNLPLIPMWVAILKIPYSVLFALILAFCVVGAYSLNNSAFGIFALLGFGVLGYVFNKLDIPLPPLVLTLILGPLMERQLRLSLEISDGDFTVFLLRPVSAALLAAAAAFLLVSGLQLMPRLKGKGVDAV